MFKSTKSTGAVVAAIALAAVSAAPSLAWGFPWSGNGNLIAYRDARLAREIAAERMRLTGRYGRMAQEHRAIRLQEERELWQNGGYLTRGQRRQIDAEESALQRQINFGNRCY